MLAAVTLEAGEEREVEKIPEQLKRFLGVNSDAVERGNRALPWRFVTAAVSVASDHITIRLDLHQVH